MCVCARKIFTGIIPNNTDRLNRSAINLLKTRQTDRKLDKATDRTTEIYRPTEKQIEQQ